MEYHGEMWDFSCVMFYDLILVEYKNSVVQMQ